MDFCKFGSRDVGVFSGTYRRVNLDRETQTWGEILLQNKKQNHSLNLDELNKAAQNRLASKYIEAESLISLRVTGNHRLYGYITGRVFNVLWYDDDHGDNSTCVCRSYLKHT